MLSKAKSALGGKRFFVFILVLFFSVMALNAATTKISTLGRNPFYGWVKDNETARAIVKDNIGAIKYALDNTGYGRIFFAFCEQIDEAGMEEVNVAPGTKMEWMLFKKRGFNKILKNAEWIGSEDFKAFLFDIFYQNNLYEFIVPQICGNIALLSVEAVEAPNEAPEPEEELIETEPSIPETIKLEEPKIGKDTKLEKMPVIRISKPRFSGVVDFSGTMVRKCYGKYLPVARLGLKYSLDNADRFGLVATIGAAMPLPINQKDTWEPFFITDLTFHSRIYRFLSLGVGAGYSGAARNTKVPGYWEGVMNIGIKIKKVAFFFETRLSLSELENIGKFPSSKMPHKFIFGIRLPINKD